MSIQLYNTLTRTKEPLQTVEPGRVKIYVCGPTVYNYIHIGNARVFVFFDVVRRYLKYRGYEVTYVQNLTDVDDKLIKASQEMGVPSRKSPKDTSLPFSRTWTAWGWNGRMSIPGRRSTFRRSSRRSAR